VSPFCAVVGCEGTITPELLNGYERFYEILVNDGKALRAEAELQAAVTQSAGTRFRLFSAEYAFASGYADYFRKTHDPKNQAERIARYRQVLEHIHEQNGDPTPTTDTEIYTYLQHAEDTLLPQFFEKFFACAEIPDNKSRFDYASIVRRAREAALA
jgi:hypothetical protein